MSAFKDDKTLSHLSRTTRVLYSIQRETAFGIHTEGYEQAGILL